MSNSPATIDPKLLEILVCPITKGPLEYDREKQELISRAAKLAYPIATAFRSCCPRKQGSWRADLTLSCPQQVRA